MSLDCTLLFTDLHGPANGGECAEKKIEDGFNETDSDPEESGYNKMLDATLDPTFPAGP